MKAIIMFLCAVLCIAGIEPTKGQTNAPTPAQIAKLNAWRSAMKDVLQKHDRAFHHWFRKGKIPNYKAFAKDISNLDTSNCPKSFQSAWVDYSTAWQILANDMKIHLDFTALTEIAGANPMTVTMGIGKLLGDASAKNSQKNKDTDDILRAIAELKKVAIHYGVHKVD